MKAQNTRQQLREEFKEGRLSIEEFQKALARLEIDKIDKPKTNNTKNSWKEQTALIRNDELKGRPSIDDIRKKALTLTDPKYQALFILLYLTGARITEVVGSMCSENIEQTMRRSLPVLIIRLENRKNRKKNTKEVIIPLYVKQEKQLVDLLNPFLEGKDPSKILFPFTKTSAHIHFKKTLGWNCHYLRHLRLTHLSLIYGFDAIKLMKWAGWSDVRPAQYYINLRTDDFLDTFPIDKNDTHI